MPCMNSTSAWDLGGSVAFVDGGSLLLGLPGAPGCTTTGVAGSVCRARSGEEKRPVGALTASSVPHSTAETLVGNLCRFKAAGIVRGVTREKVLNIICCVFRRCRSIRFDCGTSANPTLGGRYDVEPSPGGVGVSSTCAFSPALRLPVNRDRRPKHYADDHAGSQHKPELLAIATLTKCSPVRTPAWPYLHVLRQSPTLLKLLEVRDHGPLTR